MRAVEHEINAEMIAARRVKPRKEEDCGAEIVRTDDGGEGQGTPMTWRPTQRIPHEPPLEFPITTTDASTSPLHVHRSPTTKPASSTHRDMRTGYLPNTTKITITGLDETTTTTDLMADDTSFRRAMRSSEETIGPSRNVDLEGDQACVEETPRRRRRRQGFSVLAGMAAYEASHASASAPRLIVHSPDDVPAVPRGSIAAGRTTAWLAVEGQEADVSTVLPSSPSIQRYLASARGTGNESRLDRVDLAELGCARALVADETMMRETSDVSTVLPSSPAVRRNMIRLGERGDLMTGEMPSLDMRLDRSVLVDPPGGRRTISRTVTDPVAIKSAATHGRMLAQDEADQTMDLGALIKKTSRKLTSDCADVTLLLAPAERTSRSRPLHDTSMLMDMQSPFKPREGNAEESYYDLLAGDNTFMQQVEQAGEEDQR